MKTPYNLEISKSKFLFFSANEVKRGSNKNFKEKNYKLLEETQNKVTN